MAKTKTHTKNPHHNQSQKTNWENLFTHHILVEWIISLTYKEFLQINKKKNQQSDIKMKKDCEEHLQKMKIKKLNVKNVVRDAN